MTFVIVMGVSGSGKTTVGRELASRIGAPFLDADDFHPEANVRKMADGTPLTDDDRRPWLAAIRLEIEEHLAQGRDAVLACSALRRTHRAMLRRNGEPVVFVHLRVEEPELRERMERRRQHEGHFMPPGLLRSQLETLESPGPDEPAIEVEAGKADAPTVAATIAARLADWEPGHPTA